jgi:thiol-disulfide isomerase/thioredoxin
VRYESLWDYGEGHVLLTKVEMEVQSFEDTYRYLKRYAQTDYRRDGSLKYKQRAEIKECDFQHAVPKTTFTWEGMGLPVGIEIHDKRLGGITYEYAPVTSKNIELPTKLNHMETGNVNLTKLSIPYDQQMYEKAHFLLKQIENQKRTRDLWRRRYALLNKKAPELEVDNWIQSKPLRLSDLHGKVVLLEFWGFDCGPCIGEIPDLNKVFESASNSPVTVVAVHYHVPSEHADKVQAAVSKRNIKYPVCIDRKGGKAEYFHGRTFEAYGGISGIPATFLIDYEGKIRSVGNPYNHNTLKKLIDEVASGATGTSPIPSIYDKVHFAPAQINFGSVIIGETAQKSVFIYKPDDISLNVEIGSWPAAPARAGLFRYSDGSTAVFELRIILDSTDSTGSCETDITLRTNNQETPKLVIPVKASIES